MSACGAFVVRRMIGRRASGLSNDVAGATRPAASEAGLRSTCRPEPILPGSMRGFALRRHPAGAMPREPSAPGRSRVGPRTPGDRLRSAVRPADALPSLSAPTLHHSRRLPAATSVNTRVHIDRMDAKQVWRAALGELQVSLSPANFETWLRDTALVDVDDSASGSPSRTASPRTGSRAATAR